MPTLHGETLQERYARERRDDLNRYAAMTPVQIERILLDAHTATAQRDIAIRQRDGLASALREITKVQPSAAAPKLRRIIEIAARALKDMEL